MKLSGHKLFYAVLIVSVLMVNPPIVFWFNDYCVEHPLLFDWPTMYIWLEFWFLVSELLGVAYTQIRNPDSNLSLLGRS